MIKLAIASALVAGSITAAHAEYPERPINMIVAYSAGGGTDIAARTLAPFIEKYLGDDASIVVLNRPGAGGEIGFTELAQSKPDGYTIGFINTPNILTIPIQRKARYSLESFTPIANVVDDPGAFSVLPSSGIKTFDDLIAYAKENPGKLTYGSTGIGSDDHLSALEFERMTGVQLKHVPFPGNADVRTATLGGHIMMASMNISETIADVHEGALHALGQMSNERWDGATEVPTFKEEGYDVIMGSMRGIAAPAGVPEDVVAKLEEALKAAVADPEFQTKAKEQHLALSYMNAAAYKAELESLDATFRELWETTPWVQE
ncbi:tripartite tricarboxylate transporter substrate binding protein [Nitratireductor aquimarinus]|uniref:Tripartite tricarboxylate transporter substrate binding protein n=1 Tax=Nitratireductor aquimarinus TaxID=889300 RepID=A0ABU4AMK5_9HYPH|nr:tripartite tricarboxylate transporter substrate binding protein [Nitratireductor aquimarinus]MDV6227470.1 tripartite tricarboxylate transporter substrate binding protein [Nitratireductor aquimarinus]